MNYFDTAESYRWGNAEEAIGEALEGKRDQVVLSTKTKAGASDTRADMMKALDGSLKRLGTDHVDIYFNHGVNDVARMQQPGVVGVHRAGQASGQDPLPRHVRPRQRSGRSASTTPSTRTWSTSSSWPTASAQDPNFADKLRHTFHWAAMQPDLPRVLAKAKQKDIGVVAMKTLMGGRLNDMRPYERPGGTFSQAAFRWVLSSPNVDALIVSMTSTELIDEYVGASGDPKVSQSDLDLLERYADMRVGSYCQPGCSACRESCPQAVRHRRGAAHAHVRRRLRRPRAGAQRVRMLGSAAGACLTCTHRSCLARLPARRSDRRAHPRCGCAAGLTATAYCLLARSTRRKGCAEERRKSTARGLSAATHARDMRNRESRHDPLPRPLSVHPGGLDAGHQVHLPDRLCPGRGLAAGHLRLLGLLVGGAHLAGLGAAALAALHLRRSR